MRTQNSDMDTLIAALQSDLPSAEDDARMRARLATAGACVGATMVGAAALQASASGAMTSGAIAAAAKGTSAVTSSLNGGGLLSSVIGALPLSAGAGVKALIVVGALATGVSYPLVAPKVASVFHQGGARQAVSTNASPTRATQLAPTQLAPLPKDNGPVTPLVVGGDAEPVDDGKRASTLVELAVDKSRARAPDPAQGLALPLPAGTRTTSGGSLLAKGRVTKVNAAGELESERPPAQSPHAVELGSNVANHPVGVLAEETELIERALQAQRAGDTQAVRGWLSLHQQRFPKGKLTTERTRIWAQLQD